MPDISHFSNLDFELVDIGEGIVGAVLSIILWILLAVCFSLVLWIFGNILFIVILVFIAMLYWIFFRALRLVFKNSNRAKGSLLESIKWGVVYTTLYNFWIYGIFYITSFLQT